MRSLTKSKNRISIGNRSVLSNMNSSSQSVDEERAQLRNEAELNRRRSRVNMVSYETSKARFETFYLLFLKNKITKTNVWEVDAIKLLGNMVKSDRFDYRQFHTVGPWLEFCAKLFGLRVDIVYDDHIAFKKHLDRLMSGKVTAPMNNESGDEGAPNAADESNDAEQPRAKRQKKRLFKNSNKSKISKNPEKELCGKVELVPANDFISGFKVNRRPMENLFSFRLTRDRTRCFYSFMDEEVNKNDEIENFEETVDLTFPNITLKSICFPMNTFVLGETNLEESLADELIFNADDEGLVCNEDGIPLPELDGSIHNFEVESPGTDVEEDDIDQTKSLRPIDVNNVTYDVIPHFWKFKKVQYAKTSKVRYTGKKIVNETRQKRKDAKKVAKVGTELFERILEERHRSKRCTLKHVPIEQILEPYTCVKPYSELGLVSKPADILNVNLAGESVTPNDDGAEDFNYANPNDSQYCRDNCDFPQDHDDGINNDDNEYNEMEEVNEEGEIIHMQGAIKDNLVDAPEIVEVNMPLHYATRPKNINMTKLKHSAWNVITGNSINSTVDNQAFNKTIKEELFSNVFHTLKRSATGKLKEDLSYQMSFLAMMTLATEHNLKLTKLNQADFSIGRGQLLETSKNLS